MLDRVVVPSRLALIRRGTETLGYNPELNTWERLAEDTAEVLRWLRAGRERSALVEHLARRFEYTLTEGILRLDQILKWCILRHLLYLDRQPEIPPVPIHPRSLIAVYWIGTQACNLRCTYCYQDATVARPNELTTAEAKNLVDQVVETGASVFIFSGGEPFLRRDLLDLAYYSRSLGLRTNVITNGYYITKSNIKQVAEAFDSVTVSLDHGLDVYHDYHRGKGSWEKAVRAVELLTEAGVSVNVNSVLSRLGLKDIEELLRFSDTHKISRHRIIPQFPMGRGATARGAELTPDELIALNDVIYRANQRLNEACNVTTEGRYSTKRSRRSHCGAGVSEVSVDPEGWVYPCRLLQYPEFRADNIREKHLAEIVNNHPVIRDITSRTADTMHPCKTCIIKNHCGGGCRGVHYSFTSEYSKASLLFCSFLRRSFEVQAWISTGELPTDRRSHFHTSEPPTGNI